MNRSRRRSSRVALALGAALLGAPALPAATRASDAPALTDQPRAVTLPPGGTAVPLRRVGGKPVVDVRIDGRGPFAFFLDTGAGATVLDAAFAAELALPALGSTKIGDPTDPEGIAAVQHRIDRLEIGGARFAGFFAVAFDRAGLDRPGPNGESAPRGVLGMPLFRELLLTLDYPAGELRLTAERLPPADGREIVDYRLTEADLFGIPVRVAGDEYLMTLDSGSQGTISFPDTFRTTLPLRAPAREIGRGRTVGGEAIVYGATLDGSFELGAIRLTDPEVRFFGRLTHPNLGSGFLARYSVSVDQRGRRLRLAPGASPEASAGAMPGGLGDAPSASGSAGAAEPALTRYVGIYGVRRITLEAGHLTLQRLSGPQGEGPKLALTEVSPQRFALAGQSEPRLEFVLSPAGTVTALRVQTPAGDWETAPREP